MELVHPLEPEGINGTFELLKAVWNLKKRVKTNKQFELYPHPPSPYNWVCCEKTTLSSLKKLLMNDQI